MKASLAKRILTTLNTEEELAVYTGLTLMFDQMLSDVREVVEVDVRPENIYYQLTGSHDVPKKMKAKIIDGINGLSKLGHLNILAVDDKGYYILDLKKFQRSRKESYTSMDREEIRSIMAIEFKQKFNLLRVAVAIFGLFNNKESKDCYKCGYGSIEEVMRISKVKGRETVFNIFNLLEENDIIYVRHSDRYTVDGDAVKKVTNVYSRPCDKAYADDYYENRFTKRTASEEPVEASQKAVEEPQKDSVEEPVKVSEEPAKEPEKPVEEPVAENILDEILAYEKEHGISNGRGKVEEQKTETSKPAKEFNFTPVQYTKEQLEAIERHYGKKSKLTYGEVDDDEEQLA